MLTVVVSGAGSGVALGQSAAVAATSNALIVADAYVDASKPTTNSGLATTLRVDASPLQRSFLRFSLSGITGTLTKATLRVWANSSQSIGYDVYGVADTTWGETTIVDNNAPPLAGSRTGFSGAVTAGTWTSVVVTPLVSLGGSVSFALKTTSSTALSMSSRQGANAPQLVVETAASSDTQAPTTPTNVTATPFSPTRIDVAWSASSDAVGVTGYSIYRDGGTTPLTTVSGSTLAFSDTNVAGGSTHSYSVDAFDAAGNHSPASSPPASATTPDAPGCKTSTNGTAYSVTVCLTAPAAGTVSGAVPVSATASAVSLNGSLLPSLRVRFCVDDTGCTDNASGYVLSDFASPFGFSLPSSNWVDGSHTLTARPWMGDGFLGQPTPAVNLTFNNGVTTPPVNGNTFTPTSGTVPGGGQPLVVAAVGDGAAGEANETSVVNEIAAWNPNLVLYLGDVYEKGSPSEFFNYYDNGGTLYNRFRAITDPTVGNHEYSFDNQASGYFNFWDTNKHYYSVDAGGWHFISLDSTTQYNQTAPGTGQYTWLQGDLAADTSPCTLVYYHHPVYNVGPEGQFTDATRLAPLWSLLATHGGVLVLNGHDHDYQRWTPLDGSGTPNPNGVTEIVVGTGGHGLQSAVTTDSRLIVSDFSHFGALRLQLNATSADFSFITTAGATVDTGNIPCNPPPNTPPPAPSLTLTPLDGNDSVTGSTVFYKPNAASGAFKVGATATGATSMQFPNVFDGTGGATDTGSPFEQTYSWVSGSTLGSSPFAVTASNAWGTSPQSQFTVTPDATAPSTSASCNLGSCAGPFSSFVSMSLASSDTGSGAGATYYTTDGTDPTTSVTRTLYTLPFLISSTTTVRFYTFDKVGNAETPQSQTVTISSAGGVAFVQQRVASGSAATLPVTLPASVSGDTLVATVALAAGSSATVLNVTDSASGTWTKGPVGFLSGTNSRVEIWYRLNASSVTSVTVTLSASKSLAVNVSEWSGVATASAVDASAGLGFASSATVTTPSLTTTNATDLVIGAVNYPAGVSSTLGSGSFSGLSDFSFSSSVHGRAAYQITSATGSFQASWTLAGASGGNGGAILALKAVSGGGGNTPPTANPVSLPATTAVSTPWTPSVSDPDATDTLTCSIVTQPANGTATVNPNCSGGTYQSNVAFTGSDPFTYRVFDGTVFSPNATVTVTVSGGGSPPPAPTLTLTETDGTDFVSGSTVFYRQGAVAGGSFTVGATSSGATAVQFPVVFGSDSVNDTSSPFSQTYNWTSSSSGSGAKSVTASNGSGTSSPSTFTVTPDATAPVTTMSCNGAPCAGTYSSAVTVSLAGSDAGGSGVAATYYTLDGSLPTAGSTLYSGSFVVSVTTTVRFFSVDNVGNAETPGAGVTVTISGGGGGVAFVRQTTGSGTAVTLPVTLSAASVTGNTLVATIALAAGSSASVASVTDSGSGTWTPGPVGFLTGVNSRVEIWYRLGGPSATTVTVTLSAAKSAAVNVSEWSGVATASAVDGSAGAPTASSTTASTPSLATTNATDVVIGAVNYPAAATSTLGAGPFTSLSDFNSGSGVHGRAAYAITSATGSFQASWTLSILSGGSGGAILALKAA